MASGGCYIMPMKLLILEDDEFEIKRFENSINAKADFELVASTNSVQDALYYLKKNNIEGLVVDIELNKGLGGSGLDFLKELNSLDLDMRPIIIVTTNNESEAVYNALKAERVDMIYYKSKEDYNPTIILNQFGTLRPFIIKKKSNSMKSKLETEIERKKRIEGILTEELNLIGIPPQMKGSKYIFDAILYLIENENKDDCYYTNFLYDKYKVRKGGISTSIQDAINNAWRNTPEIGRAHV